VKIAERKIGNKLDKNEPIFVTAAAGENSF
jgi:hypothetical protein